MTQKTWVWELPWCVFALVGFVSGLLRSRDSVDAWVRTLLGRGVLVLDLWETFFVAWLLWATLASRTDKTP